MPINTLQATPEQEPQLPLEIERKFLPHDIDLSGWLSEAKHIEQIYLSWPEEDWNLRVRRTTDRDRALYEATLKSRPGTHSRSLVRQELNVSISEAAYNFYSGQNRPRLQKLRTTLGEGVTMDWLTDDSGTIQPFVLEIEGQGTDQTKFLSAWHDKLIDVSGMPEYDNERTAHMLWRNPEEAPGSIIDSKVFYDHANDIATIAKQQNRPVIIGIKGRSGSGKSTLTNELAFHLEEFSGLSVMKLSTDDYHRGKRWLIDTFGMQQWQNWDKPVVYNTAALAFDLREYLEKAEPINKRRFNFQTEEPVIEINNHPIARVILIEGLFPHSPDLKDLVDHMIEVPTGIATSVGRRILRDIQGRLNSSLTTAEAILRYQLEIAEPTYQKYLQ